ncbi:type IV secretion system protein [Paenalcaligenes sp. Me131]|uniref:type IV secretion system protein n=1 Tax=Paenalcaligenes sp. Me131 TaxID=3392636 RepID=UPI003D27ABD7
MKKLFMVLLLSLGVSSASVASGIPTLDINSVSQLNALLDQLETAKMQLRNAETQLKALTESSGFGYVVNNPNVRDAMRRTLPSEARNLLDRLGTQNAAVAESVQSSTNEVNAPVLNFQEETKKLRERSLQIAATKKAFAEESYQAISDQLDVLDDLQGKINATNNPKEIAELQAQIAVEQANLTATQTRMELAAKQFEAEEQLLEARSERVYSGWFGGSRLTE